MSQQTQELSIISLDVESISGTLTRNEEWLTKYEASQSKLIALAEKEGEKLSPETDKKIMEWQISAKTCAKTMRTDRMVYTSKMDEIKSMFTSVENKLEKDLYTPLQMARDRSAAIYVKEQREKEQEEARKLAKEQERITLLADAEQQVRNAYADILRSDKDELFTAFNGADSETIDAVEKLLEGVDSTFKIDRWNEIIPVLSSQLHTEKELENIVMNAKAGKFEACAPHYKAEIDGYAKYLLSLIPQRREEIAKGDEESKAAADLARKQRELEASQQADADARVQKEIDDALKVAEMNSKIAVAQAKAPSKSIESYGIEVLAREGWMQIFQMYYQNSGVEELGNIKLDQMKAWCEKYAKSSGVFIEHSSISYEEKYKAVARKASKKVEV